jgi:hypothetical protein
MVALILGDEDPGQGEVLKLAQVAEIIVNGQTPFVYSKDGFGQPARDQLCPRDQCC